jgi:UDP-N-acetylmuramate--alanine ligase
MVAQVLSEAGLDPTIVIGGKLAALGSNAKLGQGDYLVAEADESDGSFLMLRPYLAVITNIDREHMDHYPDLASIKEAFITFANSLPFYGRLFACQDDPHLASILPRINRPVRTYSTEVPADIYATDIRQKGFDTFFKVHVQEKCLGDFSLRVPGTHMVANALAAIGIALELGLPSDKIQGILSSFRGADRRFTLRGERDGVLVVDDYGHHPTEIQTTLKAARRGFPERRIIAAFQPHRFTRTQALMDEFITAFKDADLVFLTEIYPAGEKPIPGIEGKFLAEAIEKHGQEVYFVREVQDLPKELHKIAQSGDLLITFGAGSITQIGPKFLTL